MDIAVHGAAYATTTFGCGFILGPIRILWLVPRVGVRWAELIELPLMMLASYKMAETCRDRFGESTKGKEKLVGFAGLATLLAFEWPLGMILGGLSFTELFTTRDPVSGTAYYLSLLVFATFPYIVRRRSKQNDSNSKSQ